MSDSAATALSELVLAAPGPAASGNSADAAIELKDEDWLLALVEGWAKRELHVWVVLEEDEYETLHGDGYYAHLTKDTGAFFSQEAAQVRLRELVQAEAVRQAQHKHMSGHDYHIEEHRVGVETWAGKRRGRFLTQPRAHDRTITLQNVGAHLRRTAPPLRVALLLRRLGLAPSGSPAHAVWRAGTALWTSATHASFPPAARQRAWLLLKLGTRLSTRPPCDRAPQAFLELWVGAVMPAVVGCEAYPKWRRGDAAPARAASASRARGGSSSAGGRARGAPSAPAGSGRAGGGRARGAGRTCTACSAAAAARHARAPG